MFVGIYIGIVLWLWAGLKEINTKKKDHVIQLGNVFFMLFFLIMLGGTIGFTIETVLFWSWDLIKIIFHNNSK